MNDQLNHDTLRRLLERRGACLSIYLPTHRAGREISQDPIRLKNLIREAALQAQEQLSFNSKVVDAILAKPRSLLEDVAFWRLQSDGLALFANENDFEMFRLPTSFSELAYFGDHYHLKPLLGYLSADATVFVLNLSQQHVSLLEATREGLTEVDCPGLPGSMDDVLPPDDPERHLQYHSSEGRAAVYHGHQENDGEERVLQFLRACDSAVTKQLQERSAPLVLACVDYLLPLYKQVSSYPNLMDFTLPAGLDRQQLYGELQGTLQKLQGEREETASRTYYDAEAHGKASHNIYEVLEAATQGRVATVLVPEGKQVLGAWEPESGKADAHPPAKAGALDLLDVLAAETYLHGGNVLSVAQNKMPHGGVVAGIFRY